MEGKTNAGGANAYATIGVTYPSGSTLTCTNGTTTLKAKNTSGNWGFAVPSKGTWTVTATDGTNTKSESVSISTEGQSVNVVLSYNLMLFDNGNQYSTATGGWQVQNGGNSNCAINANSIYIGYIADNTSGAGHSAHTVNKVALSGYKTLKATINVTVAQNDIAFGVVSTANRTGNTFAAKTSTKTTGQQTLSVDISSCNNGSYYVLFEGLYTRASITKVWCEK